MIICGPCLDGIHKCWPGDCACTLCGVPLRKPKRVREYTPRPPREPRKPAEVLTPEMADYVARQLLEDVGGRYSYISQDEWDAVHSRESWPHRAVAKELGLSYERVRYIRRMVRPEDSFAVPSYANIARRAGCSYKQVARIMNELVALRDVSQWDAFTPPALRPPEPRTFS